MHVCILNARSVRKFVNVGGKLTNSDFSLSFFPVFSYSAEKVSGLIIYRLRDLFGEI